MEVGFTYARDCEKQASYDEGYQTAVDKACEFFAAYLAEIGYPDDWCRDSEAQKSGEQRFREFMEE